MPSAASRSGRLRSLLALLAKVGVSAFLLWLMLRNLDWTDVAARLKSISPLSLGAALALIYFGTSMSAVRWWLILAAINRPLPFFLLLRYVFVGFFFNQALPSTVGGDAMRIVLGTRAGLPVDVAFRSVFAERLIGLFVLLLLSIVGLPMMMRYFAMDYHAWVLAAVILGGLVAVVAGTLLIIVSDWLNRFRLGRLVYNVAHDVRAVLVRRSSFLVVAAASLVGQVSGCLAIWAIARGLGTSLDALHTLMVVPTVFVLLMVPVSIAGWGLRESMLLIGLGIVGVSAGNAVLTSLLYGLVNLFGSLIGGALWLFDTTRRRALGTEAEPL